MTVAFSRYVQTNGNIISDYYACVPYVGLQDNNSFYFRHQKEVC